MSSEPTTADRSRPRVVGAALRWLGVLATIGFTGLLAYGVTAQAPDRTIDDGRIALAELRGTPVVLNFWASWCDPCRAEAPVLERGWRAASRQGVLFVGLDMQDVQDDAREFLSEFSITYPNVHEAGKEVSRDYGVTGLPETFFISSDGRVVGHVIGALDQAQLTAGVTAARSGRPQQAAPGGEQLPTRSG